jgi:signal transduction histidine kinase
LLARTDAETVELNVAPTDLAEQAAEATDSFATVAAAKGVELSLDVEPAPLPGDAVRLRQLAGILLDNAIRHAPERGHVAVEVRRAGDRVTLAVDDDGPGIQPADLPRVFDRFWRAADEPEGGSGLGLAIADWIVDRHGGQIGASNRANGGARFLVELPAG